MWPLMVVWVYAQEKKRKWQAKPKGGKGEGKVTVVLEDEDLEEAAGVAFPADGVAGGSGSPGGPGGAAEEEGDALLAQLVQLFLSPAYLAFLSKVTEAGPGEDMEDAAASALRALCPAARRLARQVAAGHADAASAAAGAWGRSAAHPSSVAGTGVVVSAAAPRALVEDCKGVAHLVLGLLAQLAGRQWSADDAGAGQNGVPAGQRALQSEDGW